MKEVIDSNSGKTWIELSKEEIKMGFLAQCIENLADIKGCDYLEMFHRLEKTNITEGYILKFYDTLHTESWDNIMLELEELLTKRETLTQE